jgi:hypothetical protein
MLIRLLDMMRHVSIPLPITPLHPRWCLVIDGFFDDSGKQSDANSKFVTVAGFMADTSYWTGFVLDWANLNMRWQISKVHMTELMSGNKEFAGWSADKKRQAVREYVSVIEKNLLIGIGIAVDVSVWRALSRDCQIELGGNAEAFCFLRLLKRIKDTLVRVGDRDFVSIIFDYDRDYAKPRITRFQDVVDRDHWAKTRVSSVGFASSLSYQPLQRRICWRGKRTECLQESQVSAAIPCSKGRTAYHSLLASSGMRKSSAVRLI